MTLPVKGRFRILNLIPFDTLCFHCDAREWFLSDIVSENEVRFLGIVIARDPRESSVTYDVDDCGRHDHYQEIHDVPHRIHHLALISLIVLPFSLC